MLCRFLLSLVIVSTVHGMAASGLLAADRRVDLELVLAVDVSGSMDADEHHLQRQGYVAAFRHPGLVNVITSGPLGRIAVIYYEWAGPDSQVVTVPWTEIHDRASASAFADQLARRPVAYIRGTSISGGLLYGARLFPGNGYQGLRRVIDVSGDGANNLGSPVEEARDYVVGLGITINGLPLMLKEDYGGQPTLDRYYKDCVIGGSGAFVIPVKEEIEMARAIRRKLIREIAGRPNLLIRASSHVRRHDTDCFVGEKRRMMWDEW